LIEAPHEILKSYFQNVEFFSTLKDNDLEELQKISKLKTYGKNEFIFLQNEPGDSFFIIKKGKVCIVLEDRELACLKAGDFFGEMSLLTGNPRNASVKANEDTEVFVIEKEDFKGLIQKNQNLFNNVLEFLTKREEDQIKFKKNLDDDKHRHENSEDVKKTIFKKLANFFEI